MEESRPDRREFTEQKLKLVSGSPQQRTEKKRFIKLIGNVNEAVLASYLRNEYPQTVAVVLARVEPSRAAEALRAWGPERRHEILRRIASLAVCPAQVTASATISRLPSGK